MCWVFKKRESFMLTAFHRWADGWAVLLANNDSFSAYLSAQPSDVHRARPQLSPRALVLKVNFQPALSTTGNLLEIQIFIPHPRPIEVGTLAVEPSHLCFMALLAVFLKWTSLTHCLDLALFTSFFRVFGRGIHSWSGSECCSALHLLSSHSWESCACLLGQGILSYVWMS